MLAFERGYGITYPSIFDRDGRTLPGFRCMAPRAVPTPTYSTAPERGPRSLSALTFEEFFPIIQWVAAGRR
ncbi:hypothetical protein RFN58_35585 [Streptomyces iakyrus]|uniref:hypothetical protein n=1 Tax=Streptomyces iakyrus TaxID=68219 RepID=UPI000526B44C|nr:hypothetical protein [Streptomyces iakyrus]